MTATVVALPFVGVHLAARRPAGAGRRGHRADPDLGLLARRAVVPEGRGHRGPDLATTGLIVGFSAATWLAGRLVDSAGVPWAFAVAIGSGAPGLVVLARLPAAAR